MDQRQRAAQLAAAQAAADAAEAAERADAHEEAPEATLAAPSDDHAAASPAPTAPAKQRTTSKRARGRSSVSPSPPPVEDEAAYMQWLMALQQQEQGISAADVVKQRTRTQTQLLDPSLFNEPRPRKAGTPRQPKVVG